MAIRSLARSGVAGQKYINFLAGNPAFNPSSDFLIQEQLLTSSAASITFASIPQSYKHLQIRATMKSTDGTTSRVNGQVNGVTSGSYTAHNLRGNGSTMAANTTTTSATSMLDIGGFIPGSFFEGEGQFSAMIMDVLDYTNTSKNTTFRALSGYRHSSTSPWIQLASGVYLDTPAISSITLFLNTGSFVSGCRFSLYGSNG